MRRIQALNYLPKRCYAAARSNTLTQPLAGSKPSIAATLPPQDVQVSKMPNGLVVASLENYSPVSSVGLFVKAGCRFETAGSHGVSHVLRLAANLTTTGATAFKICRGLEALGGSLSVTSTRETMVYTAECLRDNLDELLGYLANVTTAQEFRPWEVKALKSRVQIDNALANESPQIRVVEKLHEAAYKSSLANSLYCPDYMVGRISSENLQSFVRDNFTSGRMALVGLGVNHSTLRQAAEGLLILPSGAGASSDQASYRSAEIRLQNDDDLVHALIAVEGGVSGSAETNAFSVLQRILGAGPHMKRGSNITSKLSQGIAKATTEPFDASAFHSSYSDSGLFGVYTISQADCAGQVIKAAVAQVQGVADGNVSEADVARAKVQVKTDYLMSLESSECLLEEIGTQALMTAAYQAPETFLQAMDSISKESVVAAARKFIDGKKSMAASGHLVKTPFLDEI